MAVEYSLHDMHIRSRQARQLAPLLMIRPSSARHRAQQWPDHRLDSHRKTSNSPLAILILPMKKKKNYGLIFIPNINNNILGKSYGFMVVVWLFLSINCGLLLYNYHLILNIRKVICIYSNIILYAKSGRYFIV